MSDVELFVPRAAGVGAGTVDRHLPNPRHRLIGPWCFLDVFGRRPGPDTGVGPHPHLGIQTVTWLVSGTSMHHDSLGSRAPLSPGGVSLMTAGRGIAHAEGPPAPVASTLGAQLWIALPDADRDAAPSYQYVTSVPRAEFDGWSVAVFAGELASLRATTSLYSPIVGAELLLVAGASLELPLLTGFEHGVVALEGDAEVNGVSLDGALGYLAEGRRRVTLASPSGGRLLLLGGEPFAEEIVMWWNFVARTDAEVRAAAGDWAAGRRFGEVRGAPLGRIPAPPLPVARLIPRAARPS